MAWYALYKWFIQFRKTSYINWNYWYRKYLYDEWFNSLSEKDQILELERQRRIEEERRRDGKMVIARLGVLYNMINNVTHGEMGRYMEIARNINKISLHPSKYW